jgi:hypothetical protein
MVSEAEWSYGELTLGGRQKMPDYRLYCLDGECHIAKGEWFEAKNDDEAKAFVRAKKLRVKCEIWLKNRLVATVDAHQMSGLPA